MGDTPGVHELHHDFPAARVHGIGHQTPALHLGGIEQTGDARIAQSIGRGRDALGNEQAGGGALGVVVGHQRVGRVGFDGAAARHGRHDDTVGKVQLAGGKGFKQHGDPVDK